MEQSTDDADWLVRLVAIELQRVEIEARQHMLDECARRLDLQNAERLVSKTGTLLLHEREGVDSTEII